MSAFCLLNAAKNPFSPFFGWCYWLRDCKRAIPYRINLDSEDWKKNKDVRNYFTQDRITQIKNGYKWIHSLVSKIISNSYDAQLFIGHLTNHEPFNKEEVLTVDKLLESSTIFEDRTRYKIVK